MPISSIGSSSSLIPSLEHHGRETGATRQQVVFAQITSPMPGLDERESPEEEGLSRLAEELVDLDLTYNRRLQFVVDHDSNDVIVKVIDNTTDEVVRVLPPEELQRLYKGTGEGSLLSERV